MKKILLSLFMSGIILAVHAQNYLGISNSNYAGILGATLNPSAMIQSKLSWDVNIVSGNLDMDNDFLFIPKDSLTFMGIGNFVDLIKAKHYYTRFEPNDPNKTYDFTLSAHGLGPSLMFKFGKKKNALGFTTGVRYHLVGNDAPGHQAQEAYFENRDTTLYGQRWSDDGTTLDMLGWFEYGVSYARNIYQKGKNEIDGGLTIKYLDGIGAVYLKNVEGQYNIANPHDMFFYNASADYGGIDYATFDTIDHYKDLIHGNGWGGNIGFTYVYRKDSADYTYKADCKTYVDPNKSQYLFKIGLSLSDLGKVKIEEGAETFHIETDSALWHDWRAEQFGTDREFHRSLSYIFYGDSAASFRDDHFSMSLPTALNLQADWNFYKSFYLNTTIVKGIRASSGQGVTRPDIYSLTPRFENKWFEVSVPMSLISYHKLSPRIGLCVRAGYFFVGGDAVGGAFAISDFEGADLYAGMHVFFPGKKLKDAPLKFDSVPGLTVNCGELTPHTITYTNGLKGKRAMSGSVTSTFSTMPGPCGGDVVESWDVPGCHELHKQRTVHINAAPAPAFESANRITVECGQAKASMLSYTNGAEGDCLVSGKVMSKLSVSNPDSACNTDITERWDTTDGCGNALHAERTIHVNAAPVIVSTAINQEDLNRIQLSSQSILFKLGSAVIEPNVYQVLDQISLIMLKYPNAKWRVEGYADITGGVQLNIDLTNRRAQAVKDYLMKKGVKGENLFTYGYGKTHFIATNKTAAGRAKNRRVEIKEQK